MKNMKNSLENTITMVAIVVIFICFLILLVNNKYGMAGIACCTALSLGISAFSKIKRSIKVYLAVGFALIPILITLIELDYFK